MIIQCPQSLSDWCIGILGRFPSWPTLACVGPKLVAVFQLMKNVFSVVCTFFSVALCAAGCVACISVGKRGSNLVCRLAVAHNERIHAFEHCVHRLFIGCCHRLELCLMLLLEEGEHYCSDLAFFLCCC